MVSSTREGIGFFYPLLVLNFSLFVQEMEVQNLLHLQAIALFQHILMVLLLFLILTPMFRGQAFFKIFISWILQRVQISPSPLWSCAAIGTTHAALVSHSAVLFYFNCQEVAVEKSLSLGVDNRLFSVATRGDQACFTYFHLKTRFRQPLVVQESFSLLNKEL